MTLTKMMFMNFAIAGIVASVASGLSSAPRLDKPHSVRSAVSKRTVTEPALKSRNFLAKRQKPISVSLTHDKVTDFYSATIAIGTPPQEIEVVIDTGSADLVLNSDSTPFCEEESNNCIGGLYVESSSTSHNALGQNFTDIGVLNFISINGSYATETISIGGVTMDAFHFGEIESGSAAYSILGLDYPGPGAPDSEDTIRPNLPQALADTGNINTPAFSLWLNDYRASTGSIIFGGIEKSKYTGDLVTVPVVLPTDGVGCTVGLSEIQFDGHPVESKNFPFKVHLDSSISELILPDDIVKQIYERFNVVYDAGSRFTYAYCEDALQDKNLSLTLSGKTITVPFSQLFIPATDDNNNPIIFKDGKAACEFTVLPAGSETPLLGTAFLRSAYVVFDHVNNQVSLAETVFNATDGQILEIAQGPNGVPEAKMAASPVTSVVEPTLGGFTMTGPTITGSLIPNPTPGPSYTSSPPEGPKAPSSTKKGFGNHLAPNMIGSAAGAMALLFGVLGI